MHIFLEKVKADYKNIPLFLCVLDALKIFQGLNIKWFEVFMILPVTQIVKKVDRNMVQKLLKSYLNS